MSSPSCCNSQCETPIAVQVPGTGGAQGTPGATGAAGASGSSLTVGGPVNFNIDDTDDIVLDNVDWISSGQYIYIEGAGYFKVMAAPSGLTVTVKYLDVPSNAASETVDGGMKVSPAGPAFGTGTVSSTLTDNVQGGAVSILSAGVAVLDVPVYMNVASLAPRTIALSGLRSLGFRANLIAVKFVVELVTAGPGGSSMVITPTIAGVAQTEGIVTIPTATAAATVIPASPAITTPLAISESQDFGFNIADVGGSLTGGAGHLILKMTNIDTAEAIKALANRVNQLINFLNAAP